MRPGSRVDPNRWSRSIEPDGIAVVVPWATGPDPRSDGLVRLAVARLAADGSWEGFDEPVRPRDQSAEVSTRVYRWFGVDSASLADARSATDVWQAAREFIGDRPVLVPDGELARAWLAALDPEFDRVVLGLEELAPLVVAAFDPLHTRGRPGRRRGVRCRRLPAGGGGFVGCGAPAGRDAEQRDERHR